MLSDKEREITGIVRRKVLEKLEYDGEASDESEAHFPFIESIPVSHSTSYTTSVLTSFTTIQRFPETPISSL